MNNSWQSRLTDELERLDHQQLRRRQGCDRVSADNGAAIELDFGSNDYLNLRNNPVVCAAIGNHVNSKGWGSGASPVLSGYREEHQRLESLLAELSSTARALVFSSGFACNVGCLACLADEKTVSFSDQLNHASLIDGLRLSRSERHVFLHANLDDLESKLKVHRGSKEFGLIVTESVFSMDGDEAPLKALVELAEKYDCGLVVDEAHAVGVFGPRGGGLLEELRLSDRVLLKLGTLSKAIGGIGGYAAGHDTVIEYLISRCRSYLFSTAPPAVSMLAAATSIEHLRNLNASRQQLQYASTYLRDQLARSGWQVLSGRSPIVPVIVGAAELALQLSNRLLQQGIYVPAIRPPTVPAETSRLRISLSSKHTRDDLDRLVAAMSLAD